MLKDIDAGSNPVAGAKFGGNMKNVPRKPKDIGNMNDIADAIRNTTNENTTNLVDSLTEARRYASEHIGDLAKELIFFQDGAERGPLMDNLEHKLYKLCHGVDAMQLAQSIIARRCLELVSGD